MFLAVVVVCSLLGAVVGAVYLWFFWYVSLVYLHERRRQRQRQQQRQLDDNHHLPKAQQGLSEADLQRLPTVECRTPGCGEGEDECAVCLEPFRIGDWCRLIPACSHAFHVHCADAWLSKCSVCPICRRSAAPESGEKNNVNGGDAAALQEEEARDEESGWRPPPPVDMPIASHAHLFPNYTLDS